MSIGASPLLTDLYQLCMMQAYLERGMTDTAVFEFFVRKLPKRRGFLMAAGLEQATEFLESLRFGEEDLHWMKNSGQFSQDFIDYLEGFRFTGDVEAMPEGTVFFPDEPILRVTAPLPEAQLVETRLINILHFQTLIASKAARMVLAAPDKTLVDFGLRRAHGAETGLLAARAAYIAGFEGTATVLAKPLFGMPIYGTMAHSFIQAHDDEAEAFEHFVRSRPDRTTLLIDTYDTEAGAEKTVALARRLGKEGIEIGAVRIDSGDLADHARRVRRILDAAGFRDVRIIASGGIDEDTLQSFMATNAPIDAFGIGTSLVTSSDAPSFDCAYKLQEYAGVPRRKISEEKATWPGRKQVYRTYARDGRMQRDVITTHDDLAEVEPLIEPAMRQGSVLVPMPTLREARDRAAEQLERLPEPLHRLEDHAYPVEISPALRELAREADRHAHRNGKAGDGPTAGQPSAADARAR